MKTNLTNVEILTNAKALIAEPDHWIKGNWTDSSKVCFCAMGAIATAMGYDAYNIMTDYNFDQTRILHDHAVSDHLRSAMGVDRHGLTRSSIADVNDMKDTTHEQMMGYFDKAIELAKAKQ